MIIVSQWNNIIANFDNITSLDIDRSNGRYIVECNFTNKNNIYLGEYVTEERAKEVLQEIIKSYRHYRTAECDGYTNVLEETAVFEMQKE